MYQRTNNPQQRHTAHRSRKHSRFLESLSSSSPDCIRPFSHTQHASMAHLTQAPSVLLSGTTPSYGILYIGRTWFTKRKKKKKKSYGVYHSFFGQRHNRDAVMIPSVARLRPGRPPSPIAIDIAIANANANAPPRGQRDYTGMHSGL